MVKRSKFMDAYQERIVDNPVRNYVLSALVKEGHRRGYHVILLLERLKHLKLISDRLAGIPHRIVAGQEYLGERLVEKKGKLVRVVDGNKISVEKRQKIQGKFEDSRVMVILANKVFSKGINIKRVDVIIDGGAQKSKDGALQRFGRGVRLHPDKNGLLYFDLSDTDTQNKKNWFARAARSRKRAFQQAGLLVKSWEWSGEQEISDLYDLAEKWLKMEIKKQAKKPIPVSN